MSDGKRISSLLIFRRTEQAVHPIDMNSTPQLDDILTVIGEIAAADRRAQPGHVPFVAMPRCSFEASCNDLGKIPFQRVEFLQAKDLATNAKRKL